MEGGIPLARMSSGPGLQTILDAPEAARVGSRWLQVGALPGCGLDGYPIRRGQERQVYTSQ